MNHCDKMEFLKDYDNADTISVDTLALEEMLLEERSREISELNTLGSKVYFLHTSLLYYRNPKTKMGSACYDAWKVLVKKVGGTPNTWKELGHALGISQADLDYIMNTVKEDPADIVLKVFMQNENGTLDKVVEAFIKMKRYDILKSIESPLTDLAQFFNKEDSGYHSNGNSTKTREIISYTKDLPNDLPPALSKIMILREKDLNKPSPMMRPAQNTQTEVIKNGTVLFLTYMDDGLSTAFNIKYYVDNWVDLPNVTVVTLNDRRDMVYQNPEKFIREYFEQADFIVPIVTSSYLQQIKSHNSTVPNTSENLDCKYVNFIYNLIINHYIHASGCLNTKVRSVLPKDVNVNVLRDITMYPDLMPWTIEANFDEQFQAFLKVQRKL